MNIFQLWSVGGTKSFKFDDAVLVTSIYILFNILETKKKLKINKKQIVVWTKKHNIFYYLRQSQAYISTFGRYCSSSTLAVFTLFR